MTLSLLNLVVNSLLLSQLITLTFDSANHTLLLETLFKKKKKNTCYLGFFIVMVFLNIS